MGRVNRLMERRVLRRAADQALLASLAQGPHTAGQPGGPADRDFAYKRADPVDTGETYDQEPITAPIPVAAAEDLGPLRFEIADVYDLVPEPVADRAVAGHVDPVPAPPFADERWTETADVPPLPVEPRPIRARPIPDPYVASHLDFAVSGDQPWYRTKPVAAAVVAAVVVAVLCAGWLVLRSPSTTAEQSTVEATTSAPATPTTAQPSAVSAPPPSPAPPAPPPPPPPPPPPAEPTYSAPQSEYQPTYSEPAPAAKPRVDVTRAPMSVAPVPKPVPGSDSNTPGDAPGEKPRRRGCFGFC
jgi:hypothetical protein